MLALLLLPLRRTDANATAVPLIPLREFLGAKQPSATSVLPPENYPETKLGNEGGAAVENDIMKIPCA
jgi:hypothetical protein